MLSIVLRRVHFVDVLLHLLENQNAKSLVRRNELLQKLEARIVIEIFLRNVAAELTIAIMTIPHADRSTRRFFQRFLLQRHIALPIVDIDIGEIPEEHVIREQWSRGEFPLRSIPCRRLLHRQRFRIEFARFLRVKRVHDGKHEKHENECLSGKNAQRHEEDKTQTDREDESELEKFFRREKRQSIRFLREEEQHEDRHDHECDVAVPRFFFIEQRIQSDTGEDGGER